MALEKRIAQGVSSPSAPGNQEGLPQLELHQQIELAPKNSDLKKQMAIKDLSWEVEKAEMMEALKAERRLRRAILAEKKALEKQIAPAVSSPSPPGNQGHLPQPVPDHQSPCTDHQDLSKAISDIQQQVELAPENSDLKKQMAIKECSWEVEKAKIMKALQAERGVKRQILAEKITLEKQLALAVSSPSQSGNQGRLPQPVPAHQSPCTDHQDLSKAISDIQQQVELAPENSDLKKQMAIKECSWEVEKAKIMKALQAERGVKRQILAEKITLEKQLALAVSSPSQSGNQGHLPQPVPDHQSPCTDHQDLSKAISDIQQQVELAPENSDLKKQMAIKECSWEVEKAKIMKALQAERGVKRQILAEKITLEKQLALAVSSPSQSGNQGHLPQPVPDHQSPCTDHQDLSKAISDIQQQVELAPENSDLKKQMAIKECSWEVEKAKIMKALQAERGVKRQILAEKITLEKQLALAVSSPSQSGNQGRLPQPVPDHQSPCTDHQDLSKAISDFQQQVELAPENSDLKKQMAIKECSWEVEKAKIMKALQAERGVKRQILAEKITLEKQLALAVSSLSQSGNQGRLPQPVPDHQSPCTDHQDLSKAISDIEKQVNKLYLENAVLKEKMVTKEVSWEHEKAKIMKALESEMSVRKQAEADKKVIEKVNLEWEKRWFVREEEYSARLKTLQDDFDRKNSQIIMEKDNLITNTTSEKRALEKLNLSEAKLKQQESKMILMEAEWKINLTALENQMRDEFAEKEARILDFQRLRTEAWEKETTDIKFALEMKEKEIAIIHSEAEHKMKCATPDQHHHSFLALHDSHFQRERESETLNREMNKELLLKVNQLEENIMLLTQEKNDLRISNLHLQELAHKTDKERVQMKKEEKKLAKEKEMILMKQMKESAKIEKELLKKQKKEREENEKRQKEALKKQKKGK
ncbi:uncharacterized protein ACO6RY_11511 [Pungitius sinensis]